MSALKDKWLAALRSGEYKQAHGRLKAFLGVADDPSSTADHEHLADVTAFPVGYCCLGVLANVVNPNGWKHDEYDHEDNETGHYVATEMASFYHDLGTEGELLDSEFSGRLVWMEGKAPTDPDSFPQNVLATLNDEGSDFEEIAQYIEENVEVL